MNICRRQCGPNIALRLCGVRWSASIGNSLPAQAPPEGAPQLSRNRVVPEPRFVPISHGEICDRMATVERVARHGNLHNAHFLREAPSTDSQSRHSERQRVQHPVPDRTGQGDEDRRLPPSTPSRFHLETPSPRRFALATSLVTVLTHHLVRLSGALNCNLGLNSRRLAYCGHLPWLVSTRRAALVPWYVQILRAHGVATHRLKLTALPQIDQSHSFPPTFVRGTHARCTPTLLFPGRSLGQESLTPLAARSVRDRVRRPRQAVTLL
jgi:hypothetical protein